MLKLVKIQSLRKIGLILMKDLFLNYEISEENVCWWANVASWPTYISQA
jgi:hypothetical protein